MSAIPNPCEVLMINPPWVSKDDNIWHGIKSAMPPLGLLSIASYIEEEGFNVAVMDIHVEKYNANQVRRRLAAYNPRVVGISVMTATANAAHMVARLVKEVLPESVVVMGGVHAEAVPAETLCNSAVDIVVRGDGEKPFLSICQGESPEDILGVSYRKDLEVVHNTAQEVEMDLDKYPMPAYHLVPMNKYYPAIGAYRNLPAINMLMTRGCPGKCTFCNSANTTLRTRSAERVFNEIKILRERYNVREIQFYDDTFTVSKKNVMRFCELMSEAKLGVTWTAFVRADCFSLKMGKAMKEAGCHQILIGVESADEDILKNIRKPINKARNTKTIDIAHQVGLEVRVAFIFGSQGETVGSMRRSVDYALELDPDIVMFNISTPYPGTQLFKWAQENGYLKHEEWADYELSTFVLKLPTLDEADLLDAYAEAHKRFYMRPSAIKRRLKKIRRASHVRDLWLAFWFIVLRHKLGRRGEVRADWIGHKKTDFMDLKLRDQGEARLSWEVRASEDFMAPQPLVSIASK